MSRLGELLVAAGLLRLEQVEQALRAQVMWGGRLGTNLVELYHLELDQLAKALGRLHRMPAALAVHFDCADPALQQALSPELAEQHACIPLVRAGPTGHIVIASTGPLAGEPLARIADALATTPGGLVVAVAAELRVHYQLERVYGIPRRARFLRPRGNTIPAVPAPARPTDSEPELDAAALDDDLALDTAGGAPADAGDAAGDDLELGFTPTPTPTPTGDELAGIDRRSYLRTIADPPPVADGQAVARIAIRRVAVSPPRPSTTGTLDDAARAIRRSPARDRVAERVIDALDRCAPACEAAMILVVRGDTAISWKAFHRRGGAPGEIAVPLDEGGLVAEAVALNVTLRQGLAGAHPLDRLLLATLGRDGGDLVVAPIAIEDQVICVLALATADGAPVPAAEPIASAAAAAIARLMRDTSR